MTQRCACEVGQIVYDHGAPIRVARIHPIGKTDWLIVGHQGRDRLVWVMWSSLDPEPDYDYTRPRLVWGEGERIEHE